MYYNLLVRIKNAVRAKKEVIHAPFSKLDFGVAKLLVEAGYLNDAEKRNIGRKTILEIKLRYRGREPVISDFKLVSKPGKRSYVGYRELKPVRQNYGIGVVSTPAGIMTNREARRRKLGGEYLFEVW